MTLMLIDAANLYFRAFYAIPDTVTAPDGRPVGRCGRTGWSSVLEGEGRGERGTVGWFARLLLIVKGPEGTAEFGRWVGR